MEIYVVDTETSGLNKGREDDVLEIAIAKVNLKTGSIEFVYESFCGHDLSDKRWTGDAWIINEANAFTYKDVDINQGAKPIEDVVTEVRLLLYSRDVTSYNVAFDFGSFLRKDPFCLNNDYLNPRTAAHDLFQKGRIKMESVLNFNLQPCIMLSATDECKIPGYYGWKWPSLDEAIKQLEIDISKYEMDDYSKKVIQNDKLRHRAYYDTLMASMVLIELHKRGAYAPTF